MHESYTRSAILKRNGVVDVALRDAFRSRTPAVWLGFPASKTPAWVTASRLGSTANPAATVAGGTGGGAGPACDPTSSHAGRTSEGVGGLSCRSLRSGPQSANQLIKLISQPIDGSLAVAQYAQFCFRSFTAAK
jgi:hypothetical protein